jgi:hypothetical protein
MRFSMKDEEIWTLSQRHGTENSEGSPAGIDAMTGPPDTGKTIVEHHIVAAAKEVGHGVLVFSPCFRDDYAINDIKDLKHDHQ